MKNQSIAIILGLAVLVIGAVSYSFSTNKSTNNTMGMHTQDSVPEGQHRMPDGTLMKNPDTIKDQNSTSMEMMTGMDHSMMMVKSEREFLEGMIPHHQEAVATAKEVLARGGSTPEIKKLVEDIIVAQEKEIIMMQDWYQRWYGQAYVADSKNYKPMMRDLSTLSGAALDTVFLEDMIMHHMGAIMMAQSVEQYIEHDEIKTVSKSIVTSQSQEIKQMKVLLNDI